MLVFNTCAHMQQFASEAELSGETLALVPTMGALHDGHLALIEAAKEKADKVVVSIFVNPLQFGLNEDLDAYPRQLERDKAQCLKAGADAVYAPAVEEIYPDGFGTSLHVGGLTDRLCGASRPGHFDGAATVVYLLMQHVMPHTCFFGEKDWQQLQVMKRMCDDLMVPVEIEPVATIREEDGLALSSRNQYLSELERVTAAKLFATLSALKEQVTSGEAVFAGIENAKQQLTDAGFAIDYLEYADENTLETLARYEGAGRLFVAAKLGQTRLIDNVKV